MDHMEILLVEDNAGDAVLIRQVLAECPVAVNLHIARDGEQAMTMMNDGLFQPELIILDLNIPRVTAASLLEQWKTRNLAIVVFSSSLSEPERARALDLGAREFVQKPSDLDEFTEAVSDMVERYAGPSHSTAGGAA